MTQHNTQPQDDLDKGLFGRIIGSLLRHTIGSVDFPATGERIAGFGNAISGAANDFINEPGESTMSVLRRANDIATFISQNPVESGSEFTPVGDFKAADRGAAQIAEGELGKGAFEMATGFAGLSGIGALGDFGKLLKRAFKATSRGARRATGAAVRGTERGIDRLADAADAAFEGSTVGRISNAINEPANLAREEEEIMALIRADRAEQQESFLSLARKGEIRSEGMSLTKRPTLDERQERYFQLIQDLNDDPSRIGSVQATRIAENLGPSGTKLPSVEEQLADANRRNKRLAERMGGEISTPHAPLGRVPTPRR